MKNELIKTGKKTSASFMKGLTAPLAVFSFIGGKKGYKKYFVLPFILNVAILTAVIIISYSLIYPYLSDLVDFSVSPDAFFLVRWFASAMQALAAVVLLILLFILTFFLYSIIGGVVIVPFLDPLSVKVEKEIKGTAEEEDFSAVQFFKDLFRIAVNSVLFIVLGLAIMIALAFINAVPIIGNGVYFLLNFFNVAFFLAFTCFELPLDRRRYSFREKLAVTWYFKWMVIGLGTGIFLFTFIPVVGFLGWTVATIGATKLYVEEMGPALK